MDKLGEVRTKYCEEKARCTRGDPFKTPCGKQPSGHHHCGLVGTCGGTCSTEFDRRRSNLEFATYGGRSGKWKGQTGD
jgi:hypothetical protein